MIFRMVSKSGQIFFLFWFCYNPRVWQKNRQTDGQTAIPTVLYSG